jgi:hypothetical protein
MGKMCRISRHTTSLLSGIASLERRVVKIANQGAGSLAPSFWHVALTFLLKPVSKGNLLNNFGIQSSEHFYLNFWRKFSLKRG